MFHKSPRQTYLIRYVCSSEHNDATLCPHIFINPENHLSVQLGNYSDQHIMYLSYEKIITYFIHYMVIRINSKPLLLVITPQRSFSKALHSLNPPYHLCGQTMCRVLGFPSGS